MSTEPSPYISFVATSRNDDHGGDMLHRMKIFMQGLDKQAKRHLLHVELVIVDWNPPADKPLLHEVLPRPTSGSPLQVRYIIVPHEVHQRWEYHDKFSLYQYIGKNVGIRRARSEFVLATNMDLLFSDPICSFLAREELEQDKMYRANRFDVPAGLAENISLEDQLAYCKNNILRGYDHSPRKLSLVRSLYRRLINKFLLGSECDSSLAISSVNTFACGDFTLMSKKVWKMIKGYPELIFHSYVDGFVCHTAVACGCRQIMLAQDHCTYHIAHEKGWMSMSVIEKIKLMEERPFLDYTTYLEAVQWIHRQHQPLPVNNEGWGCLHDQFEEILITDSSIQRGYCACIE